MRRPAIRCPGAIVAVLALASMLSACGDGAALDRLARGEREPVVRVVSGDALDLRSGLTVRLAGLDTPRLNEAGGEAARAALAAEVAGRPVQLLYGGARRDAYGRALAQVRRVDDGRWVQGALLARGMARVRLWPDNRAMAKSMLLAEAKARADHRGLWEKVWRVLLPEEIGRDVAGFQIVEGWVLRETPTARGVYLDFTRDRAGFAVLISPRAAAERAASGSNGRDLQGRLARVRGVIGWDGLMRVDSPEQIELLRAP